MYFTNKMCIILCTLLYITFLKECWCQIPLYVVWYFLTNNISGILILFLVVLFLPTPWVLLNFFFVSQRRSSKLVIGWKVRVNSIQFLNILYWSFWFCISRIFTKTWRSGSRESISFGFVSSCFYVNWTFKPPKFIRIQNTDQSERQYWMTSESVLLLSPLDVPSSQPGSYH